MTLLDNVSDTLLVTPPGCSEPVYFRYPTFAEWHGLAMTHKELNGGAPPADLIAKTLTTCLCDASGKPLGAEASKVMLASHRRVMWLYKKAWLTVLLSDDQVVGEIEKN
jgi:hypothetical protein